MHFKTWQPGGTELVFEQRSERDERESHWMPGGAFWAEGTANAEALK